MENERGNVMGEKEGRRIDKERYLSECRLNKRIN